MTPQNLPNPDAEEIYQVLLPVLGNNNYTTNADGIYDDPEILKSIAAIQDLIRQSNEKLLERLKTKQFKHFTTWGGKQGNCLPEDIIDDELAKLRKENV